MNDDFITVLEKCSGINISPGSELFNYWETHNCPGAYGQFINTATDGSFKYNPTNQARAQDLVVNLFNKYFITNSITDDVTSSSYNNFQNTLLDLCINPALPGICGKFLGGTGTNKGYCGGFTREDATYSPVLTNFCGCYVPPDPTYLKLTISPGCTGTTGCTGNPACDPLCHRALTSHKAVDETGEILTCPQNICVIDDIIINANESEVQGGINFNTVCMGCGGAQGGNGCLCIVAGVNVSVTMANIGVGENFNQFCGTGSVCIVEDNEGNIISEKSCQNVKFGQIPVEKPSFGVYWGILLIIIVVIILVIVISIAARINHPKVKYPTILQVTPHINNIQTYQIP